MSNTVILLLVSLALWLFYLMLFARNRDLRDYLLSLNKQIGEAARQDVLHERAWEWRWEVLNSVNYDTMLWQFWRSFDSFYPDRRFLEVDDYCHDKAERAPEREQAG